jgi:hypothetical protein
MNEKEEKPIDPLTKYLKNETSPKPEQNTNQDYVQDDNNLSGYLSVDLNALPTGMFYKQGTKIFIRAALVPEIQDYSTVVETNVVDVTEKMNQMLSSCVRVKFPNGTLGSYKDIMDNDRIFLIFMIRELTFQKNVNIAKDVKCGECSHGFKIQYRATPSTDHAKSFVISEMSSELKPFYDPNERCLVFNVNGKVWKLSPPTISLQEDFYDYMRRLAEEKQKPNVAFMKIIPYTLVHLRKISDDGIVAKEKEFKALDKEEFLFLNDVVDKMVFEIKELKALCPSCGVEVHSDFTFPAGAKAIFSIPNIFDKFTKK